jgi:glycosyltransferase involved in cell wall biosynthesis
VTASLGVSVVVPCYNGERFLREALQSAVSQTVPPLEILVVDDGSTDQSAAIAESFGPPVRVIRQANQGESRARNRAIDESRGEWIAFLDADDVWKPEKLNRQMAAAEPGVVGLQTNFFCFGSKDQVVDWSGVPESTLYSIEHLCVKRSFHISALLVRRDLPLRFPEESRYGEDLLYHLDLTLAGRIRLVPEVLTGYRFHSASQTARPEVEIDWHRSIEGWIKRNAGRIGPDTTERARRASVRRLVEKARLAYWRRDWPTYWALRRYVSGFEHVDGVKALLDERILPPWLYWLKDCWDGAVRPRSAGRMERRMAEATEA